MSTWSNLQFKFAPFEPLKPPLQGVLSILQTVEAILEALIALLKTFLLDFLSPIKALVALLLAALRAIINQIESAGIAVLLVHPDFSAGDFDKTIESVSGGYNVFETKVVSKFFDHTDIFRPQYPPGSFAGMLIFYIGVETPGDLIQQLMALLALIRHPKALSLPAPVSVKTSPIFQSSDGITQFVQTFEDIFTEDLNQKIALEWKMPSSPSSAVGPTFVSALTSFVNSFRFPNFIVERSEFATGEEVLILSKNQLSGPAVQATLAKYKFPLPVSKVEVKEFNGNPYKHFSKKFGISAELGLLSGQLTGTYRYVDDDPDLVPGKNYWYRIRAYFGTPTAYINAESVDDVINSTELIRWDGSIPRIYYGSGVSIGDASTPIRGYVPRPNKGVSRFNIHKNSQDAIKAGLLLNFEFPAATGDDNEDVVEQKVGWGSLGLLSGQVAPVKSIYGDSDSIRDAVYFKWSARHLSNLIAASAYSKPEILDLLAERWNDGVAETVRKTLNAQFAWSFIGIKSGITPSIQTKVNKYLLREYFYKNGSTSPRTKFSGPYPTRPILIDSESIEISKDDRQALADFLRIAIGSSTNSPRYLQWYSLTIGDLFPALTPFLNDFLRFIEDLLKALDSILKEIIAIIENLISKIQQLETIIVVLIQLIDLLNINISLSILFSSGDSASGLASSLVSSENKPGSSPFGLHSGMVMCAGGPGPGFLAAFKALGFILGGGWA